MEDDDSHPDAKKTKPVPARPPLPTGVKSAHSIDSTSDEKLPPKRPAQPKQATTPKKEVPSTVQQHLNELRNLQKQKVRWFYNEGKKWIPFNGKDSLVMEEEWQALQKETDASASEKLSKPTVRGKLFEVDLLERTCSPLYWKAIADSQTQIMRGTWFKSSSSHEHWEPVEETDADKIEITHQGVVRSLGYGSSEIMDGDSPIMHTLKIGYGNRVEWHDINDIKLINESTGSRLAQKIGLGGSHNLVRGWHTDATVIDDIPEISHMVFLIHGIGQIMYQTGGILSSARKLREVTDKVIKKHFKDSFPNGRVEFFPVEWRSSLKLDEGLVEAITPNNVGGLRKIINETTMDIMYYTSSFFRNEIIKSLRQQLNSIYMNFVNRNPEFVASGGKVSVISHSLGSVIFHDVLINWNDQLLEEHKQQADKNMAAEGRWSWLWGSGKRKEPKESVDESANQSAEQAVLREELRQSKNKVAELEAKVLAEENNTEPDEVFQKSNDCSLGFKIENVFNIGSPLGVFLVLKGIRPRVDLEQHILPSSVCSRYFNIYDPADPIAYRIEPLIYEHYANIPPIRINQVTKANSINEFDDIPKKENAATGWIKSWFTKASQNPLNVSNVAEFHSEGHVDLPKGEMEKVEDILKEQKALNHRLDYTLESGFVEYFSAITSHMSYWESQEFARFVLKTIVDSRKETKHAIIDSRKETQYAVGL